MGTPQFTTVILIKFAVYKGKRSDKGEWNITAERVK